MAIDEISPQGGSTNPIITTTESETLQQTSEQSEISEEINDSASPFSADTIEEGGESLQLPLPALAASPIPTLAPANMSLIEWIKTISKAIQELKEKLYEAELLDYQQRQDYYHDAIAGSNLLSTLYDTALAQAESGAFGQQGGPSPWAIYNTLAQSFDDYNTLMTTVAENDQAAIDEINTWISIYNTVTDGGAEAQELINQYGGGDEQAFIDFIHEKIGDYNNYIANRPISSTTISAAINTLIADTVAYNAQVPALNTEITANNAARISNGLDPYPLLEEVPVPDPHPSNLTLPVIEPAIIPPLIPSSPAAKVPLFTQPGPQNPPESQSPAEQARWNQAYSQIRASVYRYGVDGGTTVVDNAFEASIEALPFATEADWFNFIKDWMMANRGALSGGSVLVIFHGGISNIPIIPERTQPATDEELGVVPPLESFTDLPDITVNVVDLSEGYHTLAAAYVAYNAFITDTQNALTAADTAAADEMNTWIAIYNTVLEGGPDAQGLIDEYGGGDEQAFIDFINTQFDTYNQYVATRSLPSFQPAIDDITAKTTAYNSKIPILNAQLALVNADRNAEGLDALPPFEEIPIPNPTPFERTLSTQAHVSLPLAPTTFDERINLYLQPLVPDDDPNISLVDIPRVQEMRDAWRNETHNMLEQNFIDHALSEVSNQGPFATEADFLTAMRAEMETLAQDPNQGVSASSALRIFDDGLVNIPVRAEITVSNPSSDEELGLVDVLSPINSIIFSRVADPRQAALKALWYPAVEALLNPQLAFMNNLAIARAYLEEQHERFGIDLIFPIKYVNSAAPIFRTDIGGIGSGTGLLSFVLGLHANNLETVLATAIFNGVAENNSLPISGRLFSKLQFTALDLLSKSSLLSIVPAARFLATLLGTGAATSQAASVAVALSFGNEIARLVQSNVTRALVNGTINQLSFGIRSAQRRALNGVIRAERLLNFAIETGNSGFIRFALSQAVRAHLRLATTTRLLNALGVNTIGGISAFTRATAATLNLSLLSTALAQFGRAIGLPGIVPQLFANFSGMPTADILTAITAGSRILDVLDNPFSMLFVKQTLLDTLVLEHGFTSATAATLINDSINNVILRGGIHSFSHLRAELQKEFQKSGFSAFISHLLANETVGLIRGDLGVQFLNVPFSLNFDRSFIASSIADYITGYDADVAEQMLSDAVIRSSLLGGFGSHSQFSSDLTDTDAFATTLEEGIQRASLGTFETQGEFRNALVKELRAAGFSQSAAIFLANNIASFALDGNVIPFAGVSPARLDAIHGALVNQTASDFDLSQGDAAAIVDAALERALERGPFSSESELSAIFKEEFSRAAGEAGFANGHITFDHAIASLADPSLLPDLPGLVEGIGTRALAIFKQGGEEQKDYILQGVFGGTTLDEIGNEEKRNPLSLFHQIDDQVKTLTDTENQEELRRLIRKLTELLIALTTPNAVTGIFFNTISDSQSTFIGSLDFGQTTPPTFIQA